MISNVYSYYLNQYGTKPYSKYDSHTKSQLKNTYSKVLKINSQTPTYKIDISDDAQRYAIDLKENARELGNIANELSGGDDGAMVYKKAAESGNPELVDATYVGDSSNPETSNFEVAVKQLATNQINNGNYLQPNASILPAGEYSFDLNINSLTYEFQFNINEGESNKDVQSKLSRLINRSNIGLHSEIKEDSLGNTAISIASDNTGLDGLKATIFNIRPNADTKPDQANVDDADYTPPGDNKALVETLGLDRVSQYPGNAIFTVDGEERVSQSNDVVVNKTFALNLKQTFDEPVNISLKADADSIADSISDLISGYNKLISVAADSKNDKFDGNAKLKKEFAAIARVHKEQLSSNGLEIDDTGKITVNEEAIHKAAANGSLSDVFSSLNSFKKSIQQKADNIALNPMNYVNNKIVAYKNPQRTLNDPYNLSAYTGMMFNGYI